MKPALYYTRICLEALFQTVAQRKSTRATAASQIMGSEVRVHGNRVQEVGILGIRVLKREGSQDFT